MGGKKKGAEGARSGAAGTRASPDRCLVCVDGMQRRSAGRPKTRIDYAAAAAAVAEHGTMTAGAAAAGMSAPGFSRRLKRDAELRAAVDRAVARRLKAGLPRGAEPLAAQIDLGAVEVAVAEHGTKKAGAAAAGMSAPGFSRRLKRDAELRAAVDRAFARRREAGLPCGAELLAAQIDLAAVEAAVAQQGTKAAGVAAAGMSAPGFSKRLERDAELRAAVDRAFARRREVGLPCGAELSAAQMDLAAVEAAVAEHGTKKAGAAAAGMSAEGFSKRLKWDAELRAAVDRAVAKRRKAGLPCRRERLAAQIDLGAVEAAVAKHGTKAAGAAATGMKARAFLLRVMRDAELRAAIDRAFAKRRKAGLPCGREILAAQIDLGAVEAAVAEHGTKKAGAAAAGMSASGLSNRMKWDAELRAAVDRSFAKRRKAGLPCGADILAAQIDLAAVEVTVAEHGTKAAGAAAAGMSAEGFSKRLKWDAELRAAVDRAFAQRRKAGLPCGAEILAAQIDLARFRRG